jgi:hypothetical protein
MALSQFTSQGDQFGVASSTKSAYSEAYTTPIEADTYGKPIPLSRGTRPVVGQLLWSTSVLQETKTTVTTFETTYSPFDAYEVHEGLIVPPAPPDPVTNIEVTAMRVDCAIGFGQALNGEVITKLIRILTGNTAIYDTNDDTIAQLQSMGMTVYNGSEDQLPDPVMEKYLGAGNVPAYRGEIYVVFTGLDLLPFGGAFPEFTAILSDEATGALVPSQISGGIFGNTMGVDPIRNLLYVVANDLPDTYRIIDLTRSIEIGYITTLANIGSNTNLDACYWLNFIITLSSDGVTVIQADTGAVLDSDDELDPFNDFVISQIVDNGADPPRFYILTGTIFGSLVLYELTSDGLLIVSGRNGDFDPMETGCRGSVEPGKSLIFTGEGSKIYRYELTSSLDSRVNDVLGNLPIPYIGGSDGELFWLELNDFDLGTIVNIASIVHFPDDNTIIVFARETSGDGRIIKVGMDGKILWVTNQDDGMFLGGPSNSGMCHPQSRIVNGKLGFAVGLTYYLLDCFTGVVTDLGDSHGADELLWDGKTQRFIIDYTVNDTLYSIGGGGTVGARVPLSDILTELGLYVGFTEDQLIVDPAITNFVDGFILENGVDTDFWTLTKTWGVPYLFAVTESAGAIYFTSVVKIEAVPSYDFTLTIDDLAMLTPVDFPVNTDDPFQNAAIISTRAPDSDVVDYVKMTYKDINYDFGENTVYRQKARVPGDDFVDGKDLNVDIPELIMLTDEAASLVSNLLFNEIAQRTTHEFRLTTAHAHTLPGDTYQITVGDFVYKIKLTTITYHFDYSISCLGIDYYSDVSLIVTAGQTPVTPPYQPVQDSTSQIIVFDMPQISSGDEIGNNQLGVYYGVAGMGQRGWQMAYVYRSPTGGSYTQIDIADRELIVGRCLTAVPQPLYDVGVDLISEFEIFVENGNPSAIHTVTDQSWYGGGFLVAIGAPGRWELMSIKTFVPDVSEPRRFTCSGLIRGMRDTYMHVASHVAGDRVVFVRANAARRLIRELPSLQGDSIFYKAVGGDQDAFNAPAVAVTLSAEMQRPMSAVAYRTTIDGADDLTLSWQRQSRLAAAFVESGPETSFNEFATLEFVLEIKDGPGGAIVRTETITDAQEYVYSAADQTTDGFTVPLSAITYQVTQQSGEFGPGRTVERTTIVEPE